MHSREIVYTSNLSRAWFLMSRRLMARTHTVQIEPMAAWLGHPRDDSMKTGGTSATVAARCTDLSLRVGGNKGSGLTGRAPLLLQATGWAEIGVFLFGSEWVSSPTPADYGGAAARTQS